MIIDFHYHNAKDENLVKQLISEMDQYLVDKTVLLAGAEDTFWEYKNCRFAGNEDTAKKVADYSDRLIGGIYIDPRWQDALDVFKKFADMGFKLVKMFPPAGFYPDDEKFFPLYETIEKYNIPVLFHTGQTNIKLISDDPNIRKACNSVYADPMHCDMISRLFPKMPIILAHMGYPYYLNAWSVAHANKNIYLDISGSGPWTDGIPLVYNGLGGANFIPIDWDRVIWGSDNCLPQGEHIARMSTYMRQMGARKSDQKNIFGETAKRVLKI